MSQIIVKSIINFAANAVEVKEVVDVSKMTTGEILVDGLLYTLIGMGITFAVLIAIAFLIWCFKFIRIFETSVSNKKALKENDKIGIQPVIQEKFEVEECIDDLELVAVIAAAIASSLNTSTDNLQVRSIRKVRA
ncbi:MAG: hypothetical protein K0R15_677 [Clostridiales bacterium]|jgi:sodium pump decarboxylase gamma subunit|nr:hypothetical protein [Clostridiales bacterium]